MIELKGGGLANKRGNDFGVERLKVYVGALGSKDVLDALWDEATFLKKNRRSKQTGASSLILQIFDSNRI